MLFRSADLQGNLRAAVAKRLTSMNKFSSSETFNGWGQAGDVRCWMPWIDKTVPDFFYECIGSPGS